MIFVKSLLVILLFFNALDTMVSMLFNLLLAVKIILLCFFFFFHVVLNSFFTIQLAIEYAKLKLPLLIPIGAQVTAAKDSIET